MRGVGNQTRQEIIDFLSKLRGRFPGVDPARTKDQPAPDEPSGPPTLERLEHRVVGIRNPKKDAEWHIRAGLLGVDGVGVPAAGALAQPDRHRRGPGHHPSPSRARW